MRKLVLTISFVFLATCFLVNPLRAETKRMVDNKVLTYSVPDGYQKVNSKVLNHVKSLVFKFSRGWMSAVVGVVPSSFDVSRLDSSYRGDIVFIAYQASVGTINKDTFKQIYDYAIAEQAKFDKLDLLKQINSLFGGDDSITLEQLKDYVSLPNENMDTYECAIFRFTDDYDKDYLIGVYFKFEYVNNSPIIIARVKPLLQKSELGGFSKESSTLINSMKIWVK